MPKLNEKGAPVLFQAVDCGGSNARIAKFEFTMRGALVADDKEFAHFEECMTHPAQPSAALLQGAELMKKLAKS